MYIKNQSGVFLILFAVIVLTIAGGAFLVFNNQTKDSSLQIQNKSIDSLSKAKQALINFYLSYIPSGAASETGRLPFPDRNADPQRYDGQSDCINYGAALNNNLLLGQFPWRGEEGACPVVNINIDVKDGNGDRLWYAVSPHMVRHQNNSNFNPNFLDGATFNQWLILFDQNGNVISNRIAFILFSPGGLLPNQNRPNNGGNSNDYLDSLNIPGIGTIDNSDFDLTFVSAPQSDTFNDQLLYITIDELMPLLENRILNELSSLIVNHFNTNNVYPYPAQLGDASFNCDTTATSGFIASSNSGTNVCPATNTTINFAAAQPYLTSWLEYFIYEPRPDCIDPLNNPGCNNQPNGLTVNGDNTADYVLLSTSIHSLPSSNVRADYIEDAVNQADDQIFVTPDPAISNDLLIFR